MEINIDEIEVGDVAYFNTDHGLFYSTKRLTKGKGYEIKEVIKRGSIHNSYVRIYNDYNRSTQIQYDILKGKAVIRKEKIELLGL